MNRIRWPSWTRDLQDLLIPGRSSSKSRAGIGIQYRESYSLSCRAFELVEYEVNYYPSRLILGSSPSTSLQRVVLIDSDMIILKNMDELMEMDLPNDWIAAVHACACNPRKFPHYPTDWYVISPPYLSTQNKHIINVCQGSRELRIYLGSSSYRNHEATGDNAN